MNQNQQEDIEVIIHGDYKRRSAKSVVFVGILLVLGAIWFYPRFKAYLAVDAPVLTLQRVLPLAIVIFLFILVLSAIPILWRMYDKKKEADLLRQKEQAELLAKYHAELDEGKEMEDPMDFFSPPKKGEKFPEYHPPKNPYNDPYSPKPQGYAAEQARLGYPQAPALAPLANPDDLLFEDANQEQFEEFKRMMADKGITGSDLAMYIKFQEYKQSKKN